MSTAKIIDAMLEYPIAPSFTRIGLEARRRLFDWRDVSTYDLTRRVIVVTAVVVAELRESTGNPKVGAVVADMGDFGSVRRAAEEILSVHDRIDVLIHNAGALTHHRSDAPDGTEATVASQVVGPFLLTCLLLERLRESAQARVITMSSGGMYTAELTVDDLQMDADTYNGTKQYALAKRAQVTLNEMWAERVDQQSVVFHAMHPGWADTPGVEESLPTFRKIVGPLLRDADGGADTMVWLAADDGEPLATTGGFWLDRRVRPIHRFARTRRSDTPERRDELWEWVTERAGCSPPTR